MTQGLAITDHALVRWIERTGFIDLEPVRTAIAASLDRAVAAAGELGLGEFLILCDGLVYVVRDGAVITVIPEDGRHRHARLLVGREKKPGDA